MKRSFVSLANIARESASEPAPSFVASFFIYLPANTAFSHYVAGAMLLVTRFKMLYADWRGYLIALFALVWIANQYMSIYNRIRLDIKHEQVEIQADEQTVDGHRSGDERKAA